MRFLLSLPRAVVYVLSPVHTAYGVAEPIVSLALLVMGVSAVEVLGDAPRGENAVVWGLAVGFVLSLWAVARLLREAERGDAKRAIDLLQRWTLPLDGAPTNALEVLRVVGDRLVIGVAYHALRQAIADQLQRAEGEQSEATIRELSERAVQALHLAEIVSVEPRPGSADVRGRFTSIHGLPHEFYRFNELGREVWRRLSSGS